MIVQLKINEAIREFNRNNPRKKMTQAKLADMVFKNETISEQSKLVYLSQWQHGKMLERCRILYFVRISKILNVPLSELITVKE